MVQVPVATPRAIACVVLGSAGMSAAANAYRAKAMLLPDILAKVMKAMPNTQAGRKRVLRPRSKMYRS